MSTAHQANIPYPTYRDSGVDWLGEIPEHWEVVRLGTRFQERKVKVSDKDYPALSVTKKGVLPQLENAAKTNDGDNRKLVKKGDFVINSRSDRKSSSGISDRDGSVSLINIIIEPINIQPAFCHYLLRSYSFIEEFYKYGHGIVADLWTTRYDEMKKMMLPIPPLPEQQRIARFLDNKTALIEKAIALKSQHIALLKERLQIIIQTTVTQGLNKTTPLKNTGVDWLGKIPEHWEVVPLNRVITLNPSPTLKKMDLQQKVCFLAMEKVSASGEIQCNSLLSVGVVSQGYTYFEKNDVIIAKITPCFENGKAAYLNKLPTDFGYGSTEFFVLRCSKLLVEKFLYFIVKSHLFLKTGEAMMIGSAGQKRVPSSFIKNFPVAFPPLPEQQQIADYLEQKSAETAQAIAVIERQLRLLQEYKTTLINASVTGKICLNPKEQS